MDPDKESKDERDKKILSVAKDVVFLASGGRKPTPKHIGIGVTLVSTALLLGHLLKHPRWKCCSFHVEL